MGFRASARAATVDAPPERADRAPDDYSPRGDDPPWGDNSPRGEGSAPGRSPRDHYSPPDRYSVSLIVLASWWLAGVAIAALQVVHSDLHEHGELPVPLHWLRDSLVAVPLAAVAILAATWVSAVVARRYGLAPIARAAAWGILTAVFFAVLSIPGNQAHAVLFGAEEEAGSWIDDAIRDGLLALVASLAAVIPVVALLAMPAGRSRAHPGATRP